MKVIRLIGAVQYRFRWGYVLVRELSHWLEWGGFLVKVRRYR